MVMVPNMNILGARSLRLPALLAALLLLVPPLAACGGDDAAADDRPRVVVTTTVLGALVRELAGDEVAVDVLMPDGVDPHDFQPSARDAERLRGADLVVVNGLGLEEGLGDAIARAREEGAAVFTATDHVTLRPAVEEEDHADEGEEDHGHEGEEEHADEGEEGHAHGPDDPHIWLDPVAMSAVVAALGPEIGRRTGVDMGERTAAVRRDLRQLDTDLRARARTVPPARRTLVTGHDSMGYFAARYGFRLAGTIIPSLSSQAEPSARQLAELVREIRAARVPTIFTELGTPTPVARSVAQEAGVDLVELPTHTSPDGTYAGLMTTLMDRVVEGLRAPPPS